MSGENFSGLIRSGASHSVSVSKHTGDAKNPKNIFHSDDEDAASKTTALKTHHSVESNANIQRVESGDSATNVQSLELDEVTENVQNVGVGIAALNLQEFSNSTSTPINQQVVINESLSDNIRKLGQDKIAANMQQVPIGQGFTSNVQVIPVEAIPANQQAIIQASTEANKQALPDDDSVANKRVIASHANGENRQPILNSTSSANNAKIAALQAIANKQGVGEIPSNGKSQTIESVAPALNMQSAQEAGPAGVNRHPTDQENLKDHFEVLPSDNIERARVNFGNLVSQESVEEDQSSSAGKGKQDDKPAHVKASLTTQQVTKNKRDAFLGRLAGIKRDVGSISLKLDAMDNSA